MVGVLCVCMSHGITCRESIDGFHSIRAPAARFVDAWPRGSLPFLRSATMQPTLFLCVVGAATAFRVPSPVLHSQRASPQIVTHRHAQPLMRGDDVPIPDRAIASAVYLLPFLDGFQCTPVLDFCSAHSRVRIH